MRIRTSKWGFLCLVFAATTALAGAVNAAVFSVTSTADQVDATPGNGVCETASGNAVCTLRAAIQETNSLPGPDTIRVPAGTFELTRAGSEDQAAAGDLDVLDDLVVKGAGPALTILDGLAQDRHFDCAPSGVSGVELHIAGVTLMNGSADDGAAVRASCKLRVANSIVESNSAWNYGALYVYGAGSHLQILHSQLSNNLYCAVVSDGADEVLVRDSRFEFNEGGYGAAIFDLSSTSLTTVLDSTFTENSASDHGGAIAGGDLFVSGSTFNGNLAHTGSAIAVGSAAEIVNSTFSRNRADDGPAVFASGSLSLNNVTFYENTDDNTSGAGAVFSFASTLLSNTLFRDNSPVNCWGSFSSLGYNVSDDGSCQLTAAGDLANQSAAMESGLKANGGPTRTHALFPFHGQGYTLVTEEGSPLPPGSGGGACEATDQRGIDRPAIGNPVTGPDCDIGAYEACAFVYTTDPDSDGDGKVDRCDWDDDDDGCLDHEDDDPTSMERQGGYFKDFCGGSHPMMIFEGSDSDDDGRLNCEDPDDDDDGIPDANDTCLGSNAKLCLKVGNYPCLPSFLECLGGACVKFGLRFMSVVNPNPETAIDLNPSQIRADMIFAAPLAGLDAQGTIDRIAGKAMQTKALARTRADRFALEIWRRNADGRLVERLMRVAEYSQEALKIAPENPGQIIAIRASGRAGDPLVLGTSFATGAPIVGLRDADADLVPDAYDFCPWQPGGAEDAQLGTTCGDREGEGSF